MRPILRRRVITVLNGDPDHGIPTRIELQLCGPSDRDVPSAADPIVIVYSADDDPQLGDELRLPLAAVKEFIKSSAEQLPPNFKKRVMSNVKIAMYGPAVYESHMPSGDTMTVASLAEILARLPAKAIVLDPPKLIVQPASGDSSSLRRRHIRQMAHRPTLTAEKIRERVDRQHDGLFARTDR